MAGLLGGIAMKVEFFRGKNSARKVAVQAEKIRAAFAAELNLLLSCKLSILILTMKAAERITIL